MGQRLRLLTGMACTAQLGGAVFISFHERGVHTETIPIAHVLEGLSSLCWDYMLWRHITLNGMHVYM